MFSRNKHWLCCIMFVYYLICFRFTENFLKSAKKQNQLIRMGFYIVKSKNNYC